MLGIFVGFGMNPISFLIVTMKRFWQKTRTPGKGDEEIIEEMS